MSECFKLQSSDGRVVLSDGLLESFKIYSTAPSNGVSGYQIGCIWVYKLGSPGSIFWINVGSITSAVWLNIDGFLDGVVAPTFAPVVIPAATTTYTLTVAGNAGKITVLQSTGGLTITPPAATGTGNIYNFAVGTTISGGSVTIDFKAGNASDLIYGTAYQFKSGTGLAEYSAGTNSNEIILNGTTTGGIIGDYISIQDIGTHQWQILDFSTQATGTVATPFANH